MNTPKQLGRPEEIAAGRNVIHAPAPVTLTALTGRDTEVSLLRDRWEQAQEGMGQVVLIVGEPGLGKSRLVYTIKQIVTEQGSTKVPGAKTQAVDALPDYSVVEWRCSLRFQNTGLFPVSDYFDRFLDLGGDDSAPARFDRLARHLDDFGLGRADLVALFAKLPPTLRVELEKLVSSEILYVKGQPPNCTFAFRHTLLEEALRDALPEGERKRLHRKIAEAMETQFPEVVERQPELLAQHFAEADFPRKAVGYRLMAAVRSRDRAANVEAISHLRKGLALLEKMELSDERDAQELELLGLLGTATIASRGYADPEVGPVFDRARALCERLGQTPQRFAMMWGNYAFHVVRGDFRLCADLAEEAMEFAERLNDPGILMEALFLRGLTMLYRGDFAGAHEWCDISIAKYDDRARTASWATVIGEDAGVTNRCYLALALWHLGYPDRALQLSRETVTLAREVNHSFSLEYALHHSAWLHQLCRLGPETQSAAEEQIRIATDQGFPFWYATGTLYRAAGLTLEGRLETGLSLLENGLTAYRATGAGLGLPYYLSLLVEACIQARRFNDAHRALDEALALIEKNDEHFQEAELLRLHGVLLLAESGDQTMAEDCFRRAIETARRQRSRSFELRATTSLARLWHRQDRGHEAYEVMTAARSNFTEGFTTPDLVEAAALLKELSDDQMREEFAAGVAYVRGCIPPPMQGKVAVDWRYIPSSTLGGDTIGYHWIDEDRLALYLIDVTGHGLDSALLSVSINNMIRSGSLPGADMGQPDQVLAILNDSFQGRQHSNKFFTIWYGVYCSSEKTLTWSGGGHHASLLFAPEAPPSVSLPSTGPMMGILRGANFPVKSCLIPPGARLLIFSDGVFEIWRDHEAAWDWPACVSYLATLSQDAETVMDKLIEHVRLLRGSQQLDDDFSIIEARFDAH